ncbi:hypothetical protein [Paenibacillus sp. BR1-192]|uniref:hypothetical protein n=1 Tax=Paenibacillus sp. BR1-192 TaxID=3032287 RepID=UPI00240D62EE|nr:hypothetical protein [Paenibacillus sp. BR1-192]WFB57511.1 hypothetical protein P0X86_26635 [Paenibacillus sp. BR1-192]
MVTESKQAKNTPTSKLWRSLVEENQTVLIQNSFLAMTCSMNDMTKSEDASGEGKALRQLQAAITFLEELQECQKRPTRFGVVDAQHLLNTDLGPVTEGLKQIQIDLDMKKDHGCNHDL